MTGYTQLQGTSEPTRLRETGIVVHLALWSPLLYQTRCGISFSRDCSERVEEPVNCMACLVRADTFVVPLQAENPGLNPFNERVWFKQVFHPSLGYVIDCCSAEYPCDWHEKKDLP